MNLLKEVIFQGGLGNQMFQYAFFLYLNTKGYNARYNTSWYLYNKCHNGYELEKLFGIKPRNKSMLFNLFRTVRKLEKLNVITPGIGIIQDTIPSMFKPDFNAAPILFFDGYWQSYRYIEAVEKLIRQKFRFKENFLSEETLALSKRIKASQYAVSIHIRCGDYFSEQFSPLYGGICTPEYYSKAISVIRNTIYRPKFFVFSNDLDWVYRHIDLPADSTFVSCNNGTNAWQDMYLMSCCKHNIIANSSFSWWGAWLNENLSKIIVSPSRFINLGDTCDLILPNWIIC